MDIKITCDLPFKWCAKCEAREIGTERFYAATVIETRHYCEHQKVCEAARTAQRWYEQTV